MMITKKYYNLSYQFCSSVFLALSLSLSLSLTLYLSLSLLAQSAGAIEYTDCFSAEG